MATAAAGHDPCRLTDQAVIHVALEIDPGSEPIGGRMTVDERPPHRFLGWVELVAGIQAARAHTARSAETGVQT